MEVRVDTDLCQGHAMCVLEAADVFAFDPKTDATVRLLDAHPDETRREAVVRAVRYCPTMALSVDD